MTFMTIEDDLTGAEKVAPQSNQSVKCSWCGEIIRLDGKELALAMCQSCYEQMLAEFLRAQQKSRVDTHASDR